LVRSKPNQTQQPTPQDGIELDLIEGEFLFPLMMVDPVDTTRTLHPPHRGIGRRHPKQRRRCRHRGTARRRPCLCADHLVSRFGEGAGQQRLSEAQAATAATGGRKAARLRRGCI
jgi:hypothetical protein